MAVRALLQENWFTQEELGRRLDLSVVTLQGWRYLGKGPRFFKVGRNVRYPESAVNEWLAEQLKQPAAAEEPAKKKPPERINKRHMTRAEKRGLLNAKTASTNLQ